MKLRQAAIGMIGFLALAVSAGALYGVNDAEKNDYGFNDPEASADCGPDTTLQKAKTNKMLMPVPHPCSEMLPFALAYRDSLNYDRKPGNEAAAFFLPGDELDSMLQVNDTLILVLGRDQSSKTCIILFPKDPHYNKKASQYGFAHQTFPMIAPMANFNYADLFSCQ